MRLLGRFFLFFVFFVGHENKLNVELSFLNALDVIYDRNFSNSKMIFSRFEAELLGAARSIFARFSVLSSSFVSRL